MPKIDYLDYEPAKMRVDIYYTAREGRFHCTYAGKRYEQKEVATLKQEVLKAIKAAYALEWIPVIEMTQPGKFADPEAKLSLSVERKYVGFHADLGYKQCHWAADPERRLAVSQPFNWRKEWEFCLPAHQESVSSITTWLLYTEVTWLKLEEIMKYIRIAQRALQNSLVDENGVTQALEVSRLLFDHYTTRNNEAEEEVQ